MLYTSFLKLSTESKDKHWNNINQKKKKKKKVRDSCIIYLYFSTSYTKYFSFIQPTVAEECLNTYL